MWAIFYVKWGGQKSLYALWELNKTWAKRLSEPKYVHIPYTLEGMVARLGWDLIWMFPFELSAKQQEWKPKYQYKKVLFKFWIITQPLKTQEKNVRLIWKVCLLVIHNLDLSNIT